MELNKHFNLLIQVALVKEGMKLIYILQVTVMILMDNVQVSP
jgi:hypothetical protein